MSDLPLLCIDVDGVISLFGFEETPVAPAVTFTLIDGSPHMIAPEAGSRIQRLCRAFEPVWATGWEERANDRLPEVIGVGPLPVIHFGGIDRFSNAHWKLAGIDRFAGDRPLAWIDDSFDVSCFEWSKRREAAGIATLLVPTDPSIGIEEAHVNAIEIWAEDLRAASRTL